VVVCGGGCLTLVVVGFGLVFDLLQWFFLAGFARFRRLSCCCRRAFVFLSRQFVCFRCFVDSEFGWIWTFDLVLVVMFQKPERVWFC